MSGKDKKSKLDEKQILHWENLNDKALSLIGLSLTGEVIHYLDFDSTAHELWTKFEGLFGNKVINSKVILKQEFFKLQMKHEDSLLAHLNHIESLVTHLPSLKALAGEDDHIAVLLSSIEKIPKYWEIIPALCVTQMGYHDMVAMLVNHERRYTYTPNSNALFSKGKGKFKPFKCNHYGKLSYTKDHCFKTIAKQQHKDHANLVGAATSKDEEEEVTSTPTHAPYISTSTCALTTNIRDLSLHSEVYVLDDCDSCFLSVLGYSALGSLPKMLVITSLVSLSQ